MGCEAVERHLEMGQPTKKTLSHLKIGSIVDNNLNKLDTGWRNCDEVPISTSNLAFYIIN